MRFRIAYGAELPENMGGANESQIDAMHLLRQPKPQFAGVSKNVVWIGRVGLASGYGRRRDDWRRMTLLALLKLHLTRPDLIRFPFPQAWYCLLSG